MAFQDDLSCCNMRELVKHNHKFAKAVYTDRCRQVVTMCMKPLDCIPKEKHDNASQMFGVKSGYLHIEHWKNGCMHHVDLYGDGCGGGEDVYVVPPGDWHRVYNPSDCHKTFLLVSYCGKPPHPACYSKDCADQKYKKDDCHEERRDCKDDC